MTVRRQVVIIDAGLPWWGHMLYAVATLATCGFALGAWLPHAWYAARTRYRVTYVDR